MGLGARDTLRLEAGLPLYGHDLDDKHSPAEAGMGRMLTSTADYVGKEGAQRVREVLVPLRIEGRRSARHSDVLALPGGPEVGRVTSGSFAPSLGCVIAFAWVDAAQAEHADFVVRTARSELAARRADLPFYKEGTWPCKKLPSRREPLPAQGFDFNNTFMQCKGETPCPTLPPIFSTAKVMNGPAWRGDGALSASHPFRPGIPPATSPITELPQAGDALAVDKRFSSVNPVKAAADLVSPVSGEVTGERRSGGCPGKMQQRSYGEGWLVRVKLSASPRS